MPKSSRIPQFNSYKEMGEFWDTHSLADYWDQTEPAEFEIVEHACRRYLARGKSMERHEAVNLETVLGLAEKLNAVEKLKLVERVLVDLEPVVRAQEPEKRKPLRRKGKKQSLTDEQIKEIERKIWGPAGKDPSRRVVQLRGLWKDAPLNLTDKEFRQIRHELSDALKRRAEKAL